MGLGFILAIGFVQLIYTCRLSEWVKAGSCIDVHRLTRGRPLLITGFWLLSAFSRQTFIQPHSVRARVTTASSESAGAI